MEPKKIRNNHNDPYIIMLVDDQTIIAEAVKRMLQSQPDFEFHYCAEGAKALQTAIKLKPLVILQDLIMPDVDGLELLKAYRQHPEIKDTPVAVLSVKDNPEVKKEAFELGAHDYIVKLPAQSEFIARVRHHAQACEAGRRLSEAMRALRESQKQTQQRNIELEKINEQKNRILGVAAHDLRNPLGNIFNFSEFLIEEAFADIRPEHQEMVSYIRDLSEFTLKMVEDLLDVSTIESGALQLHKEQINLKTFLKRNVELNSLLAQKKKINLKLETASDLPLIYADPGKIIQVLNNLIGNAVKYSYPETTVRVIAEDQGNDKIRIAVVDQGQGIPESDLHKLFHPFGRANVKATGGEQSTGLGLAIARKIIEGHQGKISVSSQSGDGSTFYFTLPIHSADRE